MRLPVEQVEARERFVLDLFKKNPKMSVPRANALVRGQFGRTMRPSRLYVLREQAGGLRVQRRDPSDVKLLEAIDALAGQMKPLLLSAGIRHVVVYADRAPEVVLEGA